MSAGGTQPTGVKHRKRSLTRRRPLSDCRRQVCVKTQLGMMVPPGKLVHRRRFWSGLLEHFPVFAIFLVHVQPPLPFFDQTRFSQQIVEERKKKSLSCLWESRDWLRPGFRDLRTRYGVGAIYFSRRGSS